MVRSDQILRLPLAPLLAVQGIWVRLRTPQLPEPDGPRQGQQGTGRPLSVLVTGDSSAAGVGVDAQELALCGQLVGRLSARYSVDWRLVAQTGLTTRALYDRLTDLDGQFDVVVTALGVNDTVRFTPTERFAQDQRKLFSLLTEKFKARLIIATSVPPMEHFPALPQPLAWTLGRHARALDDALARVARDVDQIEILRPPIPFDPGYAAADGYHPGPAAYSLWAAAVADLISSQLA